MQKTNRKNSAVKLGLAAASALALTLGGVSSAYAADINIGPDEVAGFELGGVGTEAGFNYNQWHVGLNFEDFGERETSESLTFGECSVTTLAHPNADAGSHTQVLKGFPVADRPTTADGSAAALEAVVNSTSITVLEGSVTIQIPMFVVDAEDHLNNLDWTTVRSVGLGPGTYNLADLNITDSRGWTVEGDTFATLLADIAGGSGGEIEFQILGVGFTGSEGAVVETLSFSGDTYYFGTGDCAPASSTPSAPTPPKEVQTAAA